MARNESEIMKDKRRKLEGVMAMASIMKIIMSSIENMKENSQAAAGIIKKYGSKSVDQKMRSNGAGALAVNMAEKAQLLMSCI